MNKLHGRCVECQAPKFKDEITGNIKNTCSCDYRNGIIARESSMGRFERGFYSLAISHHKILNRGLSAELMALETIVVKYLGVGLEEGVV